MLDRLPLQSPKGLRAAINDVYRMKEQHIVTTLIGAAALDEKLTVSVQNIAMRLVEKVRAERKKTTGIDSFLTQYALSSDEGVALMCLAEALLRVPDNATIDNLIKDKLANADWKSHSGQRDRKSVV